MYKTKFNTRDLDSDRIDNRLKMQDTTKLLPSLAKSAKELIAECIWRDKLSNKQTQNGFIYSTVENVHIFYHTTNVW